MKKISIVVPHYTESWDWGKKLLDSIESQVNVDMSMVEVIIVNDGDDAVGIIPENIDDIYSFDVKIIDIQKSGVSHCRNVGLDNASGDIVRFCDFDDCFANILAFWLVIREYESPGSFDGLYNAFLEEHRDNDGKAVFITRNDGFNFVHARWHRRQFLIDNGIRFFDDCTIHEDACLDAMSRAMTNNIRFCSTPLYLWRWRDNSICRRDRFYIQKTYVDLLKASSRLNEWYMSKGKYDALIQNVTSIVMDSYYSLCNRQWKDVSTQEYRNTTERSLCEYMSRFGEWYDKCPDQSKVQISNVIRTRNTSSGQGTFEMETETLEQFINRIKSLNINEL